MAHNDSLLTCATDGVRQLAGPAEHKGSNGWMDRQIVKDTQINTLLQEWAREVKTRD